MKQMDRCQQWTNMNRSTDDEIDGFEKVNKKQIDHRQM